MQSVATTSLLCTWFCLDGSDWSPVKSSQMPKMHIRNNMMSDLTTSEARRAMLRSPSISDQRSASLHIRTLLLRRRRKKTGITRH